LGAGVERQTRECRRGKASSAGFAGSVNEGFEALGGAHI
jgi:hypothetical protein